MGKLICELCGSGDFMKQDGVFVCQSCGMKYTVEEAKKMMQAEAAAVSGSVEKAAQPSELDNLYMLARRERDNNQHASAVKYYEMILLKDAESWEAVFYTPYLKVLERIDKRNPMREIQAVADGLYDVFELVKKHVRDDDERVRVISEISTKIAHLSGLVEKLGYWCADASIEAIMRYDYQLNISDSAELLNRNWLAAILVQFESDTPVILNCGYDRVSRFIDQNMINKFVRASESDIREAKAYLSQNAVIVDAYRKEIAEKAAREKKERVDAYWATHADEKAALEANRADLEAQIAALNAQLDNMPGTEDAAKIRAQRIALTDELEQLGIFKLKEKKALQNKIDAANSELNALTDKMNAERKEINEHIRSLKQQIEEIEHTLTKDRL